MSEKNDEIKGEIYVLTSDQCPACRELKKELEEDLAKGLIKEIKIETEEGQKIADKLNIREIPTFILKDGKKVCKLSDEMKITECKELD